MDTKLLLKMHELMYMIRRFEEISLELALQNLVFGRIHSSIGQEAVAVGVCMALDKNDYVLSTHRSQGHALAKGTEPKKIFAEIIGKVDGLARGKGGVMHLCDLEHRLLTTTGIVGSGIPIATGVGLALKMRKRKEIVVSFFGDGAVNTGAFHEGVNLASLWNLPVLFVCENNQYAQSTLSKNSTRLSTLSERAKGYNIEGKTVDGNNVISVYESTSACIKEIRERRGPILLEAITYRVKGHFEGDSCNYRTKEEVNEWKKKCPILRLKENLLNNISKEKLIKIENMVEHKLQEAKNWALNSRYPTREVITEDVYSK